MKIIFFIPTLSLGGAEKNTVLLSNYFNKMGHQVVIYVLLDNIQLLNSISTDIKIIQCKLNKMRYILFKLKKILKNENADIIISNLWPLNFWISLAFKTIKSNAKLVLIEHINLSYGLNNYSFFEIFLAKFFHRNMINNKMSFIAVSNGVKDDLLLNFGLKSSKITVIYNPVIVSSTNNQKLYLKRNLNLNNPCILLAVGNFKPQKDYLTLIRAAKILKDCGFNFLLKIAGDGFLKDQILNEIIKLNLEKYVCLLGHVNDVSILYLNSDIYILSSRWEGLGNTIIEAMYYGCKIISTNCPSGPAEILCDGLYGSLVDVGNPLKIANEIINISKTNINLTHNYNRSLYFTDINIGNIYLNHFKTLLSN